MKDLLVQIGQLVQEISKNSYGNLGSVEAVNLGSRQIAVNERRDGLSRLRDLVVVITR